MSEVTVAAPSAAPSPAPSATPSATPCGPGWARLLWLAADPDRVQAQLTGQAPDRTAVGPLRDDISTDEIAPLPAMVHFDAALGAHAHTGFTAGGRRPIGRGALQAAGITVLVGGRRYGKGSSREHAPVAELAAGVVLVIAEGFERIYRQNADNLGLWTSTDMGLADRLQRGEVASLDALRDELLARREAEGEHQAAAILRAGGLLRYGTGPTGAAAEPPLPPVTGPQTLFDKIVDRHRLPNGFVRADRRFIHEYYTGMAAHLLDRHAPPQAGGFALHEPASITCFEDHLPYVDRSPVHLAHGLVGGARRLSQAHRAFVARHGLADHGYQPVAGGQAEGAAGSEGISHALMAERQALPGELIVGTDSHTPHSGALGCVAFGVGTTEMANAFLTGAVRLGRPAVLRIEVAGRLPAGVSAKDLALHILALPAIRAGAGVGRVFEFGGPALRAMDTDERATLTNMTAEMGGLTGLVEPDDETRRFIRERRGVEAVIEPWMRSDAGAPYAEVIALDASALSPMVARPGDPGQGLPLDALGPVDERPRLDIAYGGSCTAGKRADFEAYHAVLAWAAARGLRVAPGLRFYLQYGTADVAAHAERAGWTATFAAVGAEILQPACGACANCGPGASTRTDQVTVSAINRNFPGRSGPGAVWLASPATVAASAIAGRLVSVAELQAGAAISRPVGPPREPGHAG